MLASQQIRAIATIICLLFATMVSAAPRTERKDRKDYSTPDTQSKSDLSSIQVPLSNGVTSLPPPDGRLVTITLGIGTQNYTCNSTTSAPTPVGAKATIFDLSPFVPWVTPYLPQIPQKALDLQVDKIAASLSVLGNHIFNAAGTPCFHLGDVGDLLAKKVVGADIEAPKPDGADAAKGGKDGVNWLKLTDKGGSRGVKEVYRVDTAGGKPPKTCAQVGNIEVPYAALYWFYEG